MYYIACHQRRQLTMIKMDKTNDIAKNGAQWWHGCNKKQRREI